MNKRLRALSDKLTSTAGEFELEGIKFACKSWSVQHNEHGEVIGIKLNAKAVERYPSGK